jgi:fibronectin type 3 domain-containing protein
MAAARPATGAAATAAPPKPVPPTRYFWIQSISPHGQIGGPSDLIAVPLVDPPAPPSDPTISYDEKTLTVTWQPAAEGQAFRVYDIDSSGKEKNGRPLGDAPLKTPQFQAPIAFGVERCLAIRAVDMTGVVAVESEATKPRCVTPKDTFPPPAPANLNGLPDVGTISLRWDPVTASDLAGYLVLRGEGTGDTLQQLTPAPLTATTFVDATVRPGVTYVYVVVAVDKSAPPNVSPHSNSYSVTIR